MSTIKKPQPFYMRYVFAGLSCAAALSVVYPMDYLKTRMQLSKTGEFSGALDAFRKVAAKDGARSVYKGLGAAVTRQAINGSIRIGVYGNLQDAYTSRYGKSPGVAASLLIGCTSGAVGAVLSLPADVVMVRMQADLAMAADKRRNYSGLFGAFNQIVREERFLTLFRGGWPTIVRAMVANTSQVSSYSLCKRYLINNGWSDDFKVVLISSMTAGIALSITALPFDNAKIKIQNMKTVKGMDKEYSSMLDAIRKTIRNEGATGLWKGLTPYFLRYGPYSVLTFVFLEQLNALHLWYVSD